MRRLRGRDGAVGVDDEVERRAVAGRLLVQPRRVVVLVPHEVVVVALVQLQHRRRHDALARALHQPAAAQRARDRLRGGPTASAVYSHSPKASRRSAKSRQMA